MTHLRLGSSRLCVAVILSFNLTLGTLVGLQGSQAAAPVLRVVKASQSGRSLLTNGNFDQTLSGTPVGWHAYERGFHLAAGAGRHGSVAVSCENQRAHQSSGISQGLELSQTRPAPLVVRGWSKAANVTGGADSGYSLYVDIEYTDGTPLWGQTADFGCGTHGWQEREFVILPAKPVKSLTLYCLFRGHTGKVWFDDISVQEVQAKAGTVLFQGVPVQESHISNLKSEIPSERVGTGDGLQLERQGNAMTSVRVENAEVAGKGPSGFLVRDDAADSDFFGFQHGTCPALGLKLHAQFIARPHEIVVQGQIADTTGRDRAVTLVFAIPLAAHGWHWGDDIHRSRVIRGDGDFANQVSVHCGATGTMSLYPLAAVWSKHAGVALALDMGHPAVYRVGYQAGLQTLYIAYDFGLVRETQRFPSAANFRFVLYRFDPQWGFRAAFQKLMKLFPDYFQVRAHRQGIWMPFTDVSTVHGWQDFGFRFHEGNNNVRWDDAHGILSFRYTEPMTWWERMPTNMPRTLAAALRLRDAWAEHGTGGNRRMARVSRIAAMFDDAGQPALLFRDTPWCNGAVWSLNPNPYLPGTPNEATVYWNKAIRARLYGPHANGHLDGEYLDSLEGYVTTPLNYRREHFRYTTVPLTFATDTKRPALFKGLAVFEFEHWLSTDVHRMGKLMFANGVPYRFSFLCPWLDVLGTETDWLRNGAYHPVSDAQLCLWRTMAGAKPYLLLMNTDFDRFTHAMVKEYFQRALALGMWPSFFSHNAADQPYWQQPRWYNRDRPLFKEFIPLIRRVAEAGWHPVTDARSDNAHLLVERFGPDAHHHWYFTVFNPTAQSQTGSVQLETSAVGPSLPATAEELVTQSKLRLQNRGYPVQLGPQQVAVICLTEKGR